MTDLRYIKGIVRLDVDVDLCTGCGMCEEVCPHEVFKVHDFFSEIVDRDACMECGACATNCPVSAITVRKGTGCASAVIIGAVRNSEPTCDCSCSGDNESNKNSCC